MPDELQVIWSLESSHKLESIKTYLRNKWSEDEVKHLLQKLKKIEKIVVRFPKLYPPSLNHPKLRKAVISKHQSVLYEVEDKIIRVHTILDHRRKI